MQYIGMQKQIISIRKLMIKTKNHHIFSIQMQTICMDGQCLKKCLQIALNGNIVLKSNEYFIENYDEDSDKGYIFEADVKFPKRLHNLYCDLPLLPES